MGGTNSKETKRIASNQQLYQHQQFIPNISRYDIINTNITNDTCVKPI